MSTQPRPSTQNCRQEANTTPFDVHRGNVVWEDGRLAEATTNKGDDGFMLGEFSDGSTFTSEAPPVAVSATQNLQPQADTKTKALTHTFPCRVCCGA